MGSATSLESAEKVMMKIIAESSVSNILSFNIREVPLDSPCMGSECLKSYLYDSDGTRIDERLFPNMLIDDDYGIYPGRKPEEIRFKIGDIVEFRCGDEMRLGVVIGFPVSFERAQQINNNPRGLHLDDSDDTYTIIYDSTGCHEHVDALAIFKPKFKMHPAVERRLQKIYQDYRTFPTRFKIENATAKAHLQAILDEMNVIGEIRVPRYEEEGFNIKFDIHSGLLDVNICNDKVHRHLDRVKVTLNRILGKPVQGRGYKTKVKDNGSIQF